MKKYDRGTNLKDIVNTYYGNKSKLLEAIDKKIYYESYQMFEKMLKAQQTKYKILGKLEEESLPPATAPIISLKRSYASAQKLPPHKIKIGQTNKVISIGTAKKLRRYGTQETLVKRFLILRVK